MTTSYTNNHDDSEHGNGHGYEPNNGHSSGDSLDSWQSSLSERDTLLKKKDDNKQDGEESEEWDDEDGKTIDTTTTGFLGTIVEGVEYIQEAAVDFKDVIVEGVEQMAENIAEGVEQMAENASEIAHDIGAAIAEEAVDIKDHFVDNLVEKDDGENIMFEMGLARNLSILPSDIQDVAHPKQDDEESKILPQVTDVLDCCPKSLTSFLRPKTTFTTEVVDKIGHVTVVEQPSTRTPFHAYVTLIAAVICLSSIGPSLDMQSGVASSMKIYWRMTGTYMTLFPLALRSVWQTGLPQLTSTQLVTFALAAFCYALMCVAFVTALEFTSVGNAVIFSNSQSLLLLVGKLVVGQAVSFLEGSGALVAFSGAILCASDTSSQTGNTFSTDTSAAVVWAGVGDLLALLSAIGGVGYLVFAKTLREHIPNVFVFMFMIMFGGSLTVLTYLWVSGEVFTFNRDINIGLWGWMNLKSDRLPLEMWMVLVCNLMGAMGYVRSMQYFDNLVISVATLMEPVVASLMAYFLQVGLLPGWMGWIGNVLVVLGTVGVIYPNSGGKEATGAH